MKKNTDLKSVYESVYQGNETEYFSKFKDGKDTSENEKIVLEFLKELRGKTVLDVGCGTGSLIGAIAEAGAKKAIGIDYSETAIKKAKETTQHKNAIFNVFDFNNWTEKVDIIVSCGTFEHLDNPQEMMLKMSKLLLPNGILILTCPHFYNIRGIIWITLQKLLNVPMSLTDVHSISPADMNRWSKKSGLKLEIVKSFDYDKGNGQLMIEDMRKRLFNALNDSNLPNEKVEDMLSWVLDYIDYNKSIDLPNYFDGANCLYLFKKV